MIYNWQQKDWPEFTYDLTEIEGLLYEIAEKAGRTSGLFEGLSSQDQNEALVDLMVSEAMKTSEIEGEYLSRKDVMSSIKNNLGFVQQQENISDKKSEGAAQLMVSVRSCFSDELDEVTLFTWHEMLMQGSRGFKVGAWRDHEEPMQVVSGLIGKKKVHYEAPPSSEVPDEMKRFIQWFNETAPGRSQEITQPAVRSAITHIYFETIHPFEDGNGRIGRALSEKAISQSLGQPVIMSLSRTIEEDKKSYYEALKMAQRSNEITPWINYFVMLVSRAQTQAEDQIRLTLNKTKFFDYFNDLLSERQLYVLKRVLERGPDNSINAKNYMAITKASKATATRDLQDLVQKEALISTGGGRSTKYVVNLDRL